jgi:hypothetical protein
MAETAGVLHKSAIERGMILWLLADADEEDLSAFDRSLLERNALNHPVIVLNTLRWDHEYVWVCTVSSTWTGCFHG